MQYIQYFICYIQHKNLRNKNRYGQITIGSILVLKFASELFRSYGLSRHKIYNSFDAGTVLTPTPLIPEVVQVEEDNNSPQVNPAEGL